jgi:APA family basic amino acid/polyamine antiporter
MPHNSAIFSLLMCGVWFVYFIFLGAGLFDWGKITNYAFDSSELPIITLYALYIPILIAMMIKEKSFGIFRRFILPVLSILAIGVIIYASIEKHEMGNVWYLVVFAVIMLIGFVVKKVNAAVKKNNDQ